MGKFLKTTKTNDNFAKVVFSLYEMFKNLEKHQLVAFFSETHAEENSNSPRFFPVNKVPRHSAA